MALYSISLESLRLSQSRQFSPSLFNRLLAAIEERTLVGGANTLTTRLPGRTIISARGGGGGGGGGGGRVRFAPTLTGEAVSFGLGRVSGIEPRIGGVRISHKDDEGKFPGVQIGDNDYGEDGLCRLYARVEISPRDWEIVKVEMVARRDAPPSNEPKYGYKLIALAQRVKNPDRPDDKPTIALLPVVITDLFHGTSARRAAGQARHWFWAIP